MYDCDILEGKSQRSEERVKVKQSKGKRRKSRERGKGKKKGNLGKREARAKG